MTSLEHVAENYHRTGFLHHAHLVIFQQNKLVKFENKFAELFGQKVNFIYQKYNSFGIDESRELIRKSSYTCLNNKQQPDLFLIESPEFSSEAQNALLKLIEEPREKLHFFFLSPREDIFIITLKSRLLLSFLIDRLEKEGGEQSVVDFAGASPVERLDLVAQKIKIEKKENLIDFLNQLEKFYATRLPKSSPDLEEIIKARKYARQPATSARLLLEHLALTLSKC